MGQLVTLQILNFFVTKALARSLAKRVSEVLVSQIL